MYQPTSRKDFECILKLYRGRGGTIGEICLECGISYNDGRIYRLKPFLILYGILETVQYFDFRDNFSTRYKINHKELDRFLLVDSFFSPIYERIFTGNIIPSACVIRLKSKEKVWETLKHSQERKA